MSGAQGGDSSPFSGVVEFRSSGTEAAIRRALGKREPTFVDGGFRVSIQGTTEEITRIEKACGAHAVHPARIRFTLRAGKKADLDTLRSTGRALPGIVRHDVQATRAEFLADLAVFPLLEFRSLAEKAGYRAECTSHEVIEIILRQDLPAQLLRDLRRTFLVVELESSQKLRLVAPGRASDAALRAMFGAALREIRRP